MPVVMSEMVSRLRLRIFDSDPLKNILTGGLEFNDEQLSGYIMEAYYDVNEAEPQSNIPFDVFPKTSLLLDGALVFLLRSRGLLHLRNQISYSDAGLSVNLDDKAQIYASWMTNEVQMYFNARKEFKRSMVPGFRGVTSPMRWF